MLTSLLAISTGAVCGAILRWLFGLAFNSLFPALPLGTLIVNWLGSLIMGIAAAFFAFYPGVAPQWRLLAITGFLGSLTTFSAFAGEMGDLILQGRISLCALGISLHVGGSICMFLGGIWIFGVARKIF